MREYADIVIVGAGIVGCSTAYFLSKKTRKKIVVIEQGNLFDAGGSTSHAPGLVFELNSSKTMCQLAQWAVGTYRELEFEGEACFYSVGSLEVASTQARWEDLKNKLGRAHSFGLKAELISSKRAKELFPLIEENKVLGALYVPQDGIAKAVRACKAMGRDATREGVEFYGNTRVSGFVIESGRVKGVQTAKGTIYAEKVVLCGGIWGPQLGAMLGVPVPLVPVQHQYAKTSSFAELKGETREVVLPILRHQDKSLYFRQHEDYLGIGSYHHEPLVVNPFEVAAPNSECKQPATLPFTNTHFDKAYHAACDLIPSLKNVDLGERFNGMFSFTPDGNPLLGELTELKGLWLGEAVWVTHAAGVGRVLAEMLCGAVPSLDLRELDANRFWDHCKSPKYVELRGAQQYREVYDIIHPLQQMESPRPLRTSPFYPRQKELGAVFFESAGWERPQWYASNEKLPSENTWPERSAWSAKYWSPIIGKEHKACREKLALFDLSAFTKLEVQGKQALKFLQNLSTNQIDQDISKVVYTSMLNKEGGIVCDLTVTRIAKDKFWVITGGSVGRHDRAWLLENLKGDPPEGDDKGSDYQVSIQDITSAYCSLGLWGPNARLLLQSLCKEDVSNESFPFYTAKNLYIGCIPVTALRLSYAGELGWEIYTPTEYGLSLWDLLWEEGKKYGIVAAGGGAFDSLRLEKGYRLWGADIHTEYNPYEAGLGFAVKLQKGSFLGREALQKIKAEGSKKKLSCLILDNPNVALMGKEPIFFNNEVQSYVTSANYGYTVCKSIAYGYLPLELSEPGTELQIMYFNELYSAKVSAEPLYDKSSERLKA